MTPRFIVLEGIDGSGTTSQSRRLLEALEARGHEVVHTFQPSKGAIGRLIREHLSVNAEGMEPDALALLFAADRLDHLGKVIAPALERGKLVLCDRYVISSWVYQSLKCPKSWVRQINARATWPDLTFFLDVPAEVAMQRVANRREQTGEDVEVFDDPDLQRRLARGYATVAKDPSHHNVITIDATQSFDDVASALLQGCTERGL